MLSAWAVFFFNAVFTVWLCVAAVVSVVQNGAFPTSSRVEEVLMGVRLFNVLNIAYYVMWMLRFTACSIEPDLGGARSGSALLCSALLSLPPVRADRPAHGRARSPAARRRRLLGRLPP